jgi:hypothetical protein
MGQLVALQLGGPLREIAAFTGAAVVGLCKLNAVDP